MDIGFLIRTMPYTHQNLDTAFNLTEAALAASHRVRIFLYEDAVVAANAHIKSGSERNLAERLAVLIARGVEVAVCSTCCRFRGMAKADLVAGATLGGMGALSRMVDECDRVVTLGS